MKNHWNILHYTSQGIDVLYILAGDQFLIKSGMAKHSDDYP